LARATFNRKLARGRAARRITATNVLQLASNAWESGDRDGMERALAWGLARWPAHPVLRTLWAESELLAGRWEPEMWRAWNTCRWMHASETVRADYLNLRRLWPEWDGTERDLSGVKMFLWKEGGVGDYVLYSRYAALLEAMGAEVVWHAFPGLFDGWESGQLSVACFVPLQSLPGAFGTTIPTIPPPCLSRLGWPAWRGSGRAQRRVVCRWTGNPEQGHDAFRSITRDRPDWANEDIPGVEWVQLPNAGSWRPTLEALAAVDLVITVDTALFHVAATMGIPTWLLLADCHYPVYGWDGEALKEWYPAGNVRVFRQHAPGDWAGCIADVHQALAGTP
jgi:hypothetical protein